MSIDLVKYTFAEAEGPKFRILGMSLVSGLSRTLLLVTINTVAGLSLEHSKLPYLFIFVTSLAVYIFSFRYAQANTVRAAQEMIERMRLRISEKLLLTELRYTESTGKAEIYARLTQDIKEFSNSLGNLIEGFQAFTLLFFSMIYVAWLSLFAFAVTVLTVSSGVATYLLQHKKAMSNQRRAREKEVEFFDSISGLLDGFKEIKINLKKQAGVKDRVSGIASEYRDLNIDTYNLYLSSSLTTQVYIFALIAAVVFLLPLVLAKGNTIIFQFLAALLFLVGPLEALVSSIPVFTRCKVALENILRLETSIDNAISEREKLKNSAEPITLDSISFRHVCFEYASENVEEKFAVGPLSFSVNRGEILFIAGGNGCGKTTLLKLLAGLYTPSSGAVLTNGKEIQHQERQAYREMFTTIFSDFHLFRRLYGAALDNDEQFQALLKEVGLAGKTHYENGQVTNLNLSTGQRKRLAYIVSYLDNKQILLFDELAADQDPHFRNYFYRTILPALKKNGKTIIAVTHDDRYFDAADQLIIMEHGTIVNRERIKEIS